MNPNKEICFTDFTDSGHCKCRAHCPGCLTDADFRKSHGVADGCPHGVTADEFPPVRDLASMAATRLAICKACDNQDCGMKHRTDCQAMALLGRPGAVYCSNGKLDQLPVDLDEIDETITRTETETLK